METTKLIAIASLALLSRYAEASPQAPVTFEQKIYALETENFGYQGRSFAAEGRTLVIGHWGDGQFVQNSGAARVYESVCTREREPAGRSASSSRPRTYVPSTCSV